MNRTSFTTPVRVLSVAIALVVVVVGCVSRRGGLSRDAIERSYDMPAADKLPSIGALLALRVPAPPATAPANLLGSVPAIAFARGETVDDDAAACLRADLRRDYGALVTRCLAFAQARPADARAPAAVRIVTRHLGALPLAGRKALFEQTADIVAACAAQHGALTCADLALVVDDARRQSAPFSQAGAADEALKGLAATSPWLRQAVADGPWLDADEAFAGSPFVKLPLRKHPRHRVFDVVDRSESGAGTLVPSHRDVDGWWRVSLRGTSAAADVLLAIKSSGPLEVRVDATPVLVRPRGTLVAELERVPLHLEQGFHTIEVLGLEQGSGVRVAVLDHDGKPALTLVPKQKWGKNAGASLRSDDGAVTALALPPTIDGADADVLQTLLFRHALARAGFGQTVDDERALARLLVEQFGWSTPALVAAAQTVEADAFPERFSAALAEPLWDRVLGAWPDHPVALLSRARLAAVANPDRALGAWRALVKARPDYAIGHRELIDALLERDVVDEALASAEALLKLGETPENIDAAVPALRAAGHMSRAAALVDQAAHRSREERWRRALMAGDTAGVERTLRSRVDAGDDAVLESVLDLIELDDPATAKRLIEQALVRQPGDRRMRLRQLQLAGRPGDDDTNAAEFTSGTVDLQVLLWREANGGAVPWTPRLTSGDDVIAARRKGKEPWPGFASVFLQDDLERRFADDGTSLVIRHWIAELRSKEALDGFGELRPQDGEQLLRLRVIKADGRVIEAERHDNVDDISLPQLSPGDIVEWLSADADNGIVDGAFWETRSLQQSTPAVERRYIVSIPAPLAERASLTLVNRNGAPPATQTRVTRGGVEIVTSTFSMPGAPLLDEPMSAEREEVEPQGGIVVAVDDSFFRRARGNDLVSKSRIDPWLRRASAEIAGRGSDEDKLRRIFRFVAEAVTPMGSPADAVSVLATGNGQRLPLFLALCRAAGLEVHVDGVHSPLSVPLEIPHRSSFGNVVARVVVGDAVHVAWFNDQTAVLDRLPPTLAKSTTLDLETGVRGALPDHVIDETPTTLQLDLALKDQVLDGFVALRLPAATAEAVRPSLRQATQAQLGQMLEGALAQSFPGVQVARVTLPGLDTAAGPLAFVADVEVPVVADASGTVRFEHLFPAGAAAAFRAGTPLSAIVRVADRKRALRIFPEGERLVAHLRLPARASFVEVPDNVDLTAGPVRLTQTSSVEDGALLWERTITRTGARIDVDQWPEVRASLAPLLSRADARIAFVAVAPTSAPKTAALSGALDDSGSSSGAGPKPAVVEQTR